MSETEFGGEMNIDALASQLCDVLDVIIQYGGAEVSVDNDHVNSGVSIVLAILSGSTPSRLIKDAGAIKRYIFGGHDDDKVKPIRAVST